ncbi:hypothetical protein ABBQ38_013669 [Trebouxia sp. C0009 RCD-2024]
MSFAATIQGVPLARAFPTASLSKPRSAQSVRRAPLRVRAADPAAPDRAEVKDEVIDYAKQMGGVTQPFPNIFDPLNFLGSAGSSNNPIRDLRRWRESEVTHGRVCMLAALGFVVQEQLINTNIRPFPFVKGPAINHFQQVESQGAIFWVPLLLAIGIAESYRVAVGWNDPTSSNFYSLRDDYEPGNLGFDPLGLLPDDPKEASDMKSKELNNGRLAMIAVAGFVAQELRDGQPIFNSLGGRVLGTVEKTN